MRGTRALLRARRRNVIVKAFYIDPAAAKNATVVICKFGENVAKEPLRKLSAQRPARCRRSVAIGSDGSLNVSAYNGGP